MLDITWITESLAIGGSFLASDASALAYDHGVDAVIDVRGESCDDRHGLAAHGIDFLHLPTPDFEAIRPRKLRRGVAFAAGHHLAGRRVFVHCTHGIGRSALLGLCVLVARGPAPLDALVLAKDLRERVSPSPMQFAGWVDWLARWRRDHDVAWSVPSFDEFQAIAYRHLR
jgi:hypothetical protein